MWNIIKAQNYQIKKDMVMLLGLAGSAVIILIIIISGLDGRSFSEMTGSVYLSMAGQALVYLFPFLILLFSTRIAGGDFVDKTINYELLMGHSKWEVYFGRLATAVLWGISIVLILSILPTGFLTLVNGFGTNMDLEDMLIRYMLMLFPIIRLICGFVCLSFVLKNANLALIIGFLLTDGIIMATDILNELTDMVFTYQFALSNIKWLISDMNIVLGYVDGTDVNIYQTAVEPLIVTVTIIVSALMSIIYIFIGYITFKKRDQG